MALNNTALHDTLKVTISIGDHSGVAGAYFPLSNDQSHEFTLVDADRRFSEFEAREIIHKLQSLYEAAFADPSTIV